MFDEFFSTAAQVIPVFLLTLALGEKLLLPQMLTESSSRARRMSPRAQHRWLYGYVCFLGVAEAAAFYGLVTPGENTLMRDLAGLIVVLGFLAGLLGVLIAVAARIDEAFGVMPSDDDR